jgi:hypothetical protein
MCVVLCCVVLYSIVLYCRCGSGKWFSPCILAQFAEAGKKRSKDVHMLEKSVINMI